ncbi:MAG: M48 family metalloprotease [Planctomycetaceae bacterium]
MQGRKMADAVDLVDCPCSSCGARYRVAPRETARQATCKRCGGVVSVPAADAVSENRPGARAKQRPKQVADRAPASTADKGALRAVLSGFAGDFSRPRVTITHRLTALIVASVMILLPLIYVAFIAVIGWLTWWHASHDYVWLSVPGGRIKILAAIAYFGLIVLGCLWVLSLIKPLFLRPADQATEGGLAREAEPLLFQFAEKVADVVGSPRPEQIRLALEANAYASYDTRMLGLGRKTFTLTLGIPLASGLTLAQLAGIIAHEFGHFSQSGSTLLTRLIHRVNFWFAAAVYRHDTLDDAVEAMLDSGHAFGAIFGFCCWILVGLGRVLLWCLMYFGVIVSHGLSRRMEFDADRYEIGVVGTKTFKQSTRRLVELDVASAIAQEFAFGSLNAQGLPDDFPAFVAGLADGDKRVRKKAKKLIREERSSWLKTHPTMQSRIAAAERLDAPGIFHSELPGSIVFRDFRSHCRELTRTLYTLRFGGSIKQSDLRPAYDALETYLETMGARRGPAREADDED